VIHSPSAFRRRIAVVTISAALSGTMACGDSATLLEDAAAAVRDMGSNASAQPIPLEPIVLDCDLTYQNVETFRVGQPAPFTFTNSGNYEELVVQDPTRWVVEHCGRTETKTGFEPSGCAADDAVCTGDYPPTPDCALSVPNYTGTTIQVRCDHTTRAMVGNLDTTTSVSYRSVRLVPL